MLKFIVDFNKIHKDDKGPVFKMQLTFLQAINLLFTRKFFVRILNEKNDNEQKQLYPQTK